MALTYSIKQHLNLGNVQGKIVDITFDSSYAAGGEDVSLAKIGLMFCYGLWPMAADLASGVYTFAYNPTTKKLIAFWGDYSAAADGPHTEVAATTNLSTVVARCLVLGA